MSANETYYLREDVFVDPLVNKWYAWPNLIAPVTYSMYMTKTHRRLMSSFVNNYELHILANQDKGMAGGGEFVNCSAEQVEDIRALIAKFDSEHRVYGELADAIKQLDVLIKSHTSGETIEPLYEQVPDMLKGYVELFMDLYHQPSYRLIESLLYRSEYYDKSIQSMSFGLLSQHGSRPFVLSTPRLPDDNHLHLNQPFDSEVWDRIFRTRETPATAEELAEWFSADAVEGGLAHQDIFTTEAPSRRHEPVTEGLRVRYTGHAGFLIETSDTAILVDPVIANRTESNADQVISYSELPSKIDYVCLTHNHSDHVNLETLLQLRYKIGTVVVPKNNGGSLADPSLKLILTQLGFKVIEVEDLEEIALPAGRILSIPFLGEHGDLNIRSKTAWFFEIHGKKIYAGADSSNLEPRMYQHIHEITGDLDVLAIGMECVGAPYTWLYGALTTEAVSRKIKESRRLNGSGFEKASRMVETFNASQVLIYALGMEPWYGYFMGVDYNDDSAQIVQSGMMLTYCEERGIPVQRLCGKHTVEL
ncbi:MAG: tyrosine beta-hydroxylase [Acidobacteria bacterium]|nr:tyrosine beta-hydroxylase [Acidobacteriota bacterium]